MKFALVFPGQGSQSVGMMNGYGESSIVRATFDEASAVLGRDLWRMVMDGPAEVLSQTINTQPLMLAAGVAVFRLWRDRGGPFPAVAAGHSLGEYSALVAAGALRFPDAVEAVQLRAQAMQEAVPQGEGAMAAVLGLDDDAVRSACAEAAQGQVVEPVNFNAPSQVVIAGHALAVARAAEAAKARGAKRAVMLPVSAPFHCSLMAPAAARLATRLESIPVSEPTFPVLHNVDALPRGDARAIRAALVRQAHSPVLWVDTIRAMAHMGVSHVFEAGPGKVLAGLTKRIDGALQGGGIVDDASLQQALATLQ
ncbi:MAG: ACP S-malonyltransferase [Betaproteobacteria bacterium]|nr:ACP S-malonyltransferase [Betaproteobacteria bacterium]